MRSDLLFLFLIRKNWVTEPADVKTVSNFKVSALSSISLKLPEKLSFLQAIINKIKIQMILRKFTEVI
jgi:hypothetical protein